MADILIGDQTSHPSLKLAAGQVLDFGLALDPDTICNYCGKPYSDATKHPGFSLPDGLLTYDDKPVTYHGRYVSFSVVTYSNDMVTYGSVPVTYGV